MALFKNKKKTVTYETEASLPSYYVDQNGFIMFSDASLGGAAVLEITPRMWTEAFTHEDPYDKGSTEVPGYKPRTGFEFSDARDVILPGWVAFVNSLQAHDVSDEPTHIQILAKKSSPPIDKETGEQFWDTSLSYAMYNLRRDVNKRLRAMPRNSRKRAMMQNRFDDYMSFLRQLDMETSPQYDCHIHNELPVELRRIQSYTTRFYIIVSYTPTGEGWWMDGRDSDYYISDNASPVALFKDDQIVDKVVDMIVRRRSKNEVVEEGDFFHLESDRIAQVLATRVNKILKFARDWDYEYWEHKDDPDYSKKILPFGIKRLTGLEAAALVKFFPDIHTPYWDKIWDLRSNEDDVLYGVDVQTAIYTRDYESVINKELSRAIADAEVHIATSRDEREAYLDQFRTSGFEDVASISSDYDDESWSPEREEQRAERAAQRGQHFSEVVDLWGDLDESLTLDDDDKTDEQRRRDYLAQFQNRGGGSVKQLFNKPGLEQNDTKAPGTDIDLWAE